MDRCEFVQDTTEIPKEAPKEKMENMTGEVGCGSERLGFGYSASPVERQGSDLPYQSTMGPTFSTPCFSVSLNSSNTSAEEEGFQCSAADTDCLICFEQYTLCRTPKVLACQHVFCSVCLKLLLQKQVGGWSIICPVCRKPTTLFGGLICSLSTKELPRQGTSANLDPKGEGPCFPDSQRGTETTCGTFSISQEDSGGGSNREAAKRLIFLLLVLALLVILALPFMYGGLLKWTLCVAVIWGLAMAGVLCWDPKWRCRCSDVCIPVWRKTASPAAPMA